jgi:2-methylisocitrate lyase-like PEP mutase family enzyme
VRTVGVKLFISARTDVYLNQVGKPESWVEETISRATKYQAAGADGLFVPGITEASAIRADVVLVQPGLYSTQLYNNIKAPADAERNDRLRRGRQAAGILLQRNLHSRSKSDHTTRN